MNLSDTVARIQKLHLPSTYSTTNTYTNHTLTRGDSITLASSATPNDLFASWIVLIHRLSLEEDFSISRTRGGSDSKSAEFLPISFHNQKGKTISYSQVLKDLEQNESIPFESLNEILESSIQNTETSLEERWNQFVQVAFVEVSDESDLSPLHIAELFPHAMQLILCLHGENQITLYYQSSLFSPDAASQILKQFSHLHQALATQREEHIHNHSLCIDEYSHLLPNPAEPLPKTEWVGPIHEIFEGHATKTPEQLAVIDAEEQITFHQLNVVANQLARKLRARGLKHQETVAIFGHRSSCIVWAILAALKAGASVCILDAKYPASRIEACIQVAKPACIIQIEASGELPSTLQKSLVADGSQSTSIRFVEQLKSPLVTFQQKLLSDYSNQNLSSSGTDEVHVSGDDIAVITFTSGSTGLPKGVLGRHEPLTAYYPWMTETFQFSVNDRFSMSSGISHDPLQRDIFTPFYLGSTIYSPNQSVIANPGELAQWFKEARITVTCLTPAMGQLLTSGAGIGGGDGSVQLPDLRWAFFVGDVLTKKFVERLSKIAPNCRVINMFGSTETQRSVTYYIVPRPSDAERETEHSFLFSELKGILPIGVGMKGAEIIVLSRHSTKNQLAGIGEMGELCMRSRYLSAGYMGLEKETNAKFITNPFIPEDKGDRFYRTGDLGRYLSTGDAECLGRADNQIKIRGFRIEIDEINTVVNQHQYVKECVTIVRTDLSRNSQEKKIVTYPVFERNIAPSPKLSAGERQQKYAFLARELKAHIRSKLPDYMVPSYIIPLDELPLTPNLKILRNRLPKPEMTSLHDEKVEPRNELDRELARIWEEVLGVTDVSVHDNFFDLGGHSINASMLTFKLRKEVKGAESLPVELLFEASTIAQMSDAIAALRRGEKIPSFKEGSNSGKPSVDLAQEIILNPKIRCKTFANGQRTEIEWDEQWANPKSIFLTGATGFLGSFLLGDLLKRTEADIYILVRSETQAKGLSRIEDALRHRLLMTLDENHRDRIHIVLGDLAQPFLGLSEELFERLAREIQVILHNGARVHWMLPYEKLKPTNVNGSIEVLKLASYGDKAIPVHFVSTTSVFDSPSYSSLSDVYEDSDLPHHKDLNGGYAQSKFVAEKLMMEARSRGIPTCIYRPGYITGHSGSGIWNPDDWLCRMIKGCCMLGCYPWIDTKLDMSPVDFVSAAIVHLMKQEDAVMLHKAYHVVNPAEFQFHALFRAATRIGYRITELPIEEWKQELFEAYEQHHAEGKAISINDNPLFPLVTYFNEDFGISKPRPWYDNTNILEALSGTKIQCPPVIELLGSYYRFLVLCGYMDMPSKPSQWAKKKLGFDNEAREGLKRKISMDKKKKDLTRVSPHTFEHLMRNNRA